MEASAEAAAKAKADEERAAKAAAREEEKKRKAEEREAAKAAKAAEAEAAKQAKTAEQIAKLVGEVEWEGDAPTFETVAEAREAVKTRKAEIRAAKPKKAPLTLSQRRAMLRLAEAGKAGIVPKTDFNALPFIHLVGVGLAEEFDGTVEVTVKKTVEKEVEIPKAEREEGGPTTKTVKEKVDETETREAKGYRLNDAGVERAGEINPKWKDWKPEGAASAS